MAPLARQAHRLQPDWRHSPPPLRSCEAFRQQNIREAAHRTCCPPPPTRGAVGSVLAACRRRRRLAAMRHLDGVDGGVGQASQAIQQVVTQLHLAGIEPSVQPPHVVGGGQQLAAAAGAVERAAVRVGAVRRQRGAQRAAA